MKKLSEIIAAKEQQKQPEEKPVNENEEYQNADSL